jgi:hypothetical protein
VVYTRQLRKLFEIVCPDAMWSEDKPDMVNGGYFELAPVPVHTVISPRFARSTAVVLLYSLGVRKEIIASFTGHRKMDIFEKHYFEIFQGDKKYEADKALSRIFGKLDANSLSA